jgi:hypothetical protein
LMPLSALIPAPVRTTNFFSSLLCCFVTNPQIYYKSVFKLLKWNCKMDADYRSLNGLSQILIL